MEGLLSNLSAYDIMNSILPGTVAYVFVKRLFEFEPLLDLNTVEKVILFYFYGVIISRVASLIIKPVSERINLVRYAKHEDYLYAESLDEKVRILSETNNNYRNFFALFIMIGILKCLYNWNLSSLIIHWDKECWIILLLIILFAWSYHNQTNYVRNRVEYICKNKGDK